MQDFSGKVAVVTGGGTGMGRGLAQQLSAAGAHVAMCDLLADNLAASKASCEEGAASGVRITTHACDVSDETQVNRFRDEVVEQHQTGHVNLLFNNAGIGGGGSFVNGDRAEWERTFGVCWTGVYNCARAFMPLLVASDEGYIVNTSSVNGFWACLGPGVPHTAYSAAKFAVKGFSEALITDLRINAPHVKVAVVMPGHIGTDIAINTRAIQARKTTLEMSGDEVAQVRKQWSQAQGAPGNVADMTDDEIRQMVEQMGAGFRDRAPVSASQAATVILDGVRNGEWRILIGEDAHRLDEMVRSSPLTAYGS